MSDLKKMDRPQEDIAIIGASCRFPGSSNDTRAFWDLLYSGTDPIVTTEVRWGDNTPAKTCKFGGFVDDVECFDSAFFRVLPKEAIKMDPQHRFLLELHWEAFESACLIPEALRGSDTGVYTGVSWNDYEKLCSKETPHSEQLKDFYDLYLTTGTTHSMASGILSNFFDFRGPSFTVDTACSTSLVCVHLACQGIRNKDCDIAFASAVCLNLTPDIHINFSQAGMLSDRCKVFDARGNGYVRSEGAAVVVLKSYSKAVQDGNRILGIIKATSVNQNGQGHPGITAPSPQAQGEVYLRALNRAGINPRDVDYIEAHGTGTPVGDPAELKSICAVFGKQEGSSSQENKMIGIGSVKSNIGHTETTAGLAGLIKVLLSFEHEVIPPNLHFAIVNGKSPNLSANGLEIINVARKWKRNVQSDKARIAAVNSFGFTGTNAQAIITEPPLKPNINYELSTSHGILTLSAKTKTSLDGLKERYFKYFKSYFTKEEETNPYTWLDITYTTNIGRTHFPQYRLAIFGDHVKDIAFSKVYQSQGKITAPTPAQFVFSGSYNLQLVKFGSTLFETQWMFKQSIIQCKEAWRIVSSTDLLNSIFVPENDYHGQLKEIIAFTIEYCIASMYVQLDIHPKSCLCYGLGEYVGACISGIMSLQDTYRLLKCRSELPLSSVRKCDAAIIRMERDALEKLIRRINPKPAVGIFKIPVEDSNSVGIYGETIHINQVVNELKQEEFELLRSQLSLPNQFAIEFIQTANQIKYEKPKFNFICGTNGKVISTTEILHGSFWYEERLIDRGNLIQSKTKQESGLTQEFLNIFIGKNYDFLNYQADANKNLTVIYPTDMRTLYESFALLYSLGHDLNFVILNKGNSMAKFIDLPKYCFDKKKYWFPRSPLVYSKCEVVPSHKIDSSNESKMHKGQLVETTNSKTRSPILFSKDFMEQLEQKIPKCWNPETELYQQQFEELCLHHILVAIMKLNVPRILANFPNLENLRTVIGVAEGHFALFEHFIKKLSKAEYFNLEKMTDSYNLSLGPNSFPSSIAPVKAKIDDLTKTLINLDPSRRVLLELVNLCGNDLDLILKGKARALVHLFPPPNKSHFSADRFYAEDPDLHNCNQLLENIIERGLSLKSDKLEKSVLRILEVGAGTGGTTTYVLSALKKNNIKFEYVFTDISTSLFKIAQKKFSTSCPNMQYKILNVEEDPISQGFNAKSFDLIFGSNVIHATKSIKSSILNLAKVLSPGGYVIFCEYIRHMISLDVVFGCLSGWWRFKGNDTLRLDYPLLSQKEWMKLLGDTNFEDSKCIGFPTALVIGRYKTICENETAQEPPGLERQASITSEQTSGGVGLRSSELSNSECFDKALSILLNMLSKLTGLQVDEIDQECEFSEMGMNSLLLARFANNLSDKFSVADASKLVQAHPTVRDLARHFSVQLIESSKADFN